MRGVDGHPTHKAKLQRAGRFPGRCAALSHLAKSSSPGMPPRPLYFEDANKNKHSTFHYLHFSTGGVHSLDIYFWNPRVGTLPCAESWAQSKHRLSSARDHCLHVLSTQQVHARECRMHDGGVPELLLTMIHERERDIRSAVSVAAIL
jgi:hypothetical protein